MDIGSVLLGLALLAVIAFVVARPLIEQSAAPEHPAGAVDNLLARRERVLTQLRDLDFDHAMSKINEEDYAAQRAQLVAEGVAILKQLDALGVAEPASSPPAAAVMRDEEIEAAVAQLRARRAAAERPQPAGLARPAKRDQDAEIEAAVAARRSAGSARPSLASSAAVSQAADASLAAAPALGTSSALAAVPVAAAEVAIVVAPSPARSGSVEKAGASQLACAQCAAEVLPDDRFCPRCGSALILTCGNCGRSARVGDQFCASCGQPLPAPTVGLRPAQAQG